MRYLFVKPLSTEKYLSNRKINESLELGEVVEIDKHLTIVRLQMLLLQEELEECFRRLDHEDDADQSLGT